MSAISKNNQQWAETIYWLELQTVGLLVTTLGDTPLGTCMQTKYDHLVGDYCDETLDAIEAYMEEQMVSVDPNEHIEGHNLQGAMWTTLQRLRLWRQRRSQSY